MSYRQSQCRGCGKAIEWAEIEERGQNGERKFKRIPLDARAPTYQMVDDGYGNLSWQRSPAMVSHFVTCPNADQFSKRAQVETPLNTRDHVEEEEQWWQK